MRIVNATILMVFTALTVCCSSPGGGAKAEEAPPVTIQEICRDPAGFEGQVVRLEGEFMGYRATECRFCQAASRAGVTRSDWLIRQESDCLFVGGDPPPGIDPVDPSFLGKPIEVQGKVIRKGSGKLYLNSIESAMVSQSGT